MVLPQLEQGDGDDVPGNKGRNRRSKDRTFSWDREGKKLDVDVTIVLVFLVHRRKFAG